MKTKSHKMIKEFCMAVNNMILRIQRRNWALTDFKQERIAQAIYKAAKDIGGFEKDAIEGINDTFYLMKDDFKIANFLSEIVTSALNLDEKFHTTNFRPHVENIQDIITATLRNFGFIQVAEAYEAYRWGRDWIRQGVITEEQFVGSGFDAETLNKLEDWNRQHGCDTIDNLNSLLESNQLKNTILSSIDLYNSDMQNIINKFKDRIEKDDIKLVIISGPSSSGKTTTTELIKQKIKETGLDIVQMNLDNYFWDIDQHPVDWVSDRNYETVEALDYQLINEHLHKLLDGQSVKMPYYNFKSGQREGFKDEISLNDDQVLLWDSHLGICPYLTEGLKRENLFIVYIEAMNPLKDEKGDYVKFTDIRLLRRMLRDAKHRNHDPLKTIIHWHYVRKGELHYIIPLRKRADYTINGGFFFDIPALKPDIEPIYPAEKSFEQYKYLLDAYIRYNRIKNLLYKVNSMKDRSHETIPGDCLIREFIGGQTIVIPHND